MSASGSKPEKLNESKCFPLCTRKQTFRKAVSMSFGADFVAEVS